IIKIPKLPLPAKVGISISLDKCSLSGLHQLHFASLVIQGIQGRRIPSIHSYGEIDIGKGSAEIAHYIWQFVLVYFGAAAINAAEFLDPHRGRPSGLMYYSRECRINHEDYNRTDALGPPRRRSRSILQGGVRRGRGLSNRIANGRSGRP